jgi:digeranylgeranylglycerophospholipid reductase
MIAGKIAGETAAEFAAGKCRLEEYDRAGELSSGKRLDLVRQGR